jgi:hypothetical protein
MSSGFRNVEVRQVSNLSPEVIAKIEKEKKVAHREAQDFTVSFVLIDQEASKHVKRLVIRSSGSGTLVFAGNRFGILTAYHVAKRFPGVQLGMVITDRDTTFHLERDDFVVIPIGLPHSEEHPELGPDLAVIWILNPDRLATIQSKKSFYRLTDRSFDEWNDPPLKSHLKELFWWVLGAPDEFASYVKPHDVRGEVLAATHFSGEATFCEILERAAFDFIEVEITAGSHNYPSDYGGVSGGGIWLTPMEQVTDDPLSVKHMSVVLAGVPFCQGPPGATRRIFGHGPKSIHDLATAALLAAK